MYYENLWACNTCLPTYFLTNQPINQPTKCRKQSPFWEANRCSDSHEIPHILWKLKAHYHVHHSPPSVPILRQINPVHALPSYFLKIHFNNIIPYSKCSPSFRFPNENPVHIYFHHHICHMPNSSHPPWFDQIAFGEEKNSWSSIMQFSTSSCYFLPLGPK